MKNKKAISAIGSFLILLIIIIVAGIILFSFQSKALGGVPSELEKPIAEKRFGEITCDRSPTADAQIKSCEIYDINDCQYLDEQSFEISVKICKNSNSNDCQYIYESNFNDTKKNELRADGWNVNNVQRLINVSFTAETTKSPCGEPMMYYWDFKDGSEVVETDKTNISHVYSDPEPGKIYSVELNVIGNVSGLSSTDIVSVVVKDSDLSVIVEETNTLDPPWVSVKLNVEGTPGPINKLSSGSFQVIHDKYNLLPFTMEFLGNGEYSLAFKPMGIRPNEVHSYNIRVIPSFETIYTGDINYSFSSMGETENVELAILYDPGDDIGDFGILIYDPENNHPIQTIEKYVNFDSEKTVDFTDISIGDFDSNGYYDMILLSDPYQEPDDIYFVNTDGWEIRGRLSPSVGVDRLFAFFDDSEKVWKIATLNDEDNYASVYLSSGQSFELNDGQGESELSMWEYCESIDEGQVKPYKDITVADFDNDGVTEIIVMCTDQDPDEENDVRYYTFGLDGAYYARHRPFEDKEGSDEPEGVAMAGIKNTAGDKVLTLYRETDDYYSMFTVNKHSEDQGSETVISDDSGIDIAGGEMLSSNSGLEAATISGGCNLIIYDMYSGNVLKEVDLTAYGADDCRALQAGDFIPK